MFSPMLNTTRIVGKMTLTFNLQSYTNLLVRYQPKPIVSHEDYEKSIALAEEMDHRDILTPEEDVLLELLVTLIEKYESVHEPIPNVSGRSVLINLMDAQDVTAGDLVPILGSAELVDQILLGKQLISQVQATLLADRFHVTAQAFL